MDEEQVLRRRAKAGYVEVHPTDSALVVFYEVEAEIIAEHGGSILADRTLCQKQIRVPALTPKTDVAALAQRILSKCKYIMPSQLGEVEQLLAFLQQRNRASGHNVQAAERAESKRQMLVQAADKEQARLADIDDYIEMLYDDTKSKIRGTALILQLVRSPENLAELTHNETMLGALARVMREDGLKSPQLTTNIVSIFFFFSSYSEFHPVVSHFKIGATCVKIVEQEMERYTMWQRAIDKRRRKLEKGELTEQEQLLYVALHLLLNLAEDTQTEIKMVRKGLVPQLVTLLDRMNYEFLTLVVTFLKKLSVFEENTAVMIEHDIVTKLAKFVPHECEPLQTTSLRLLLNLSCKPELRKRMIDVGLLPRLSQLLDEPEVQLGLLVTLLYNLSLDEDTLPLFGATETIPSVMRLILTSEAEYVEVEPVALAINLAKSYRNAKIMCEGSGLKLLLKRGLRVRDPVLLKLVRTLCQHEQTKELLLDFIDPLGKEIQACHQDADMLVELVGILAQLDIENFNFEALVTEYDLIPLMRDILQPGVAEDDLVLEVVILVGTILSDPACAPLVAQSGLVEIFIELLKQKQEDDEIVLQIVFVWNKLLFYTSTRRVVLQHSRAVSYLLDLMHDTNDVIRKVVAGALDIVAECDEHWAAEIRIKQFQFHNGIWLDMVLGEPDQNALDDVDLYEQEHEHDDDFEARRHGLRLDDEGT
ncbi:uncharacterized protein MONBRDRAFT_22625 [Monosiga brevicollis MX1]|uniref:Kinesin-associated protein 3 n=1 Tax=Monosiga brevicollis TaxID=81824 RepID=A9UNK4_MONBE|nr:uncharacterized protein MONBRDRAFT_22625 [Monosiga brevicollis MX1]EDQ93153.1 predicted protein [Monosiga brevicollis MX1]|eukprot:XP_001742915.1 hypothetical protein [Monosiga brevicollis MX1]